MLNRRNYYRILHVQPEAPTPVISASYRAMMQKCRMHPDLGGSNEVASIINCAYETLSCPVKRAEYDKTLTHQQRHNIASTGQSCPFCSESIEQIGTLRCPSCQAPLTPAQKITPINPTDKRVLPRLCKTGVIFYTTDPLFPMHKGQSLDLTPNGMRLIIPERLVLNQLIKIENAVLAAIARVAHSEATTTANFTRIGVEFITVAFTQAKSQFVDRQV